MDWKEQVKYLEQEGSFDIAIFVLEKEIKERPDNLDAYIFLLYRFMDLFLENACYWSNISKDRLRQIKSEYYDAKKWQYVPLVQKCFDESYARFSDDPEYLYYASKIVIQFYWYIDLKVDENLIDAMYEKAKASGYNSLIEQSSPKNEHDIEWAKRILSDPSIQEQLATKGAAAEYVIGSKVFIAKRILDAHKK